MRFIFSNLVIWYIDKSKLNKRLYYATNTLVILINASIPVINLFLKKHGVRISSTAAAVTTVLISLNTLFHWKDNWTRYRNTAEVLKKIMNTYLIDIKKVKDEQPDEEKRIQTINKLNKATIEEIYRYCDQERVQWLETCSKKIEGNEDK